MFDGVSVVVPTWNRADLLGALLESLDRERGRYDGDIEAIVVDSSSGEQREEIKGACNRFGARFTTGDDSVRRKRNKGISLATHDLILFLDSDVTVAPGLIGAHVDAYSAGVHVGAVQGLTEFTGDGGFWWRVAVLSGLTESFDNARKYPFQSWSITNNFSVRRDVLERVGGFDERMPFRLGGDDLELSYRIGASGFLIASAPDAVAWHSKRTWDSPAALLDRSRRWGNAEGVVCEMHPELLKRTVPPNYVFWMLSAAGSVPVALLSGSWAPILFCSLFALVLAAERWLRELRGTDRIRRLPEFLASRLIRARYEAFRLSSHAKRGRLALAKGMVFNVHQIKYGYKGDVDRMWLIVVTAILCAFLTGAVVVNA